MRVIIGLGNPEKEYRWTRHNMGFEVVNKLAFDHNIEINKAKFRAHLGEGRMLGEKILLVKPQTYMNLSGESVREILNYYKLTPADIIVIYDAVEFEPGKIRVRERGSAGGHNGMKNMIYHLDTDEFVRVRVGIGEKPPGWELADYVTSKIKKIEMDDMIMGITKAGEAVETIIRSGVDEAMCKYNGTGPKEREG